MPKEAHEHLTTHAKARLGFTENLRSSAVPQLHHACPGQQGTLEQAPFWFSQIRASIRGNVDYVTADPLPRLPPGKVKKATALCSWRPLGCSRFLRGCPNAKLDVCDLLRGQTCQRNTAWTSQRAYQHRVKVTSLRLDVLLCKA